jgi:quercetin dioxygenase-like cupin family protein
VSEPTKKRFDAPDATMNAVQKISLDIVEVGGHRVVRVTAEPGWRWSIHSKPVQQTDSCQIDHLMYVVSGQLGSRSSDGAETSYTTGDVAHIPPDHDGWTIGDQPAIWIELPH